jgi:hypothetical protein
MYLDSLGLLGINFKGREREGRTGDRKNDQMLSDNLVAELHVYLLLCKVRIHTKWKGNWDEQMT